MNLDFSDDQKFLKEEARKFLEKEEALARNRSVLESNNKVDENLWNKIQTTERPLVKEGREKIYKLYQSRENRYDQSNYILDISDKKIKSIAEIIIMNSWLKNETI